MRSQSWSQALAGLVLGTVVAFVGPAAMAGDGAAVAPPPARLRGAALRARVGELLREAETGSASERRRAWRKLEALGPAAAPALRAALSRRRALAARGVMLLGRLDPRAAKALREDAADDGWTVRKALEVEERIRSGDFLGAIHWIDAILALAHRTPIASQLRARRVWAKELYVRQNLVAARLVLARVLLDGETRIELRLELENVSDRAVRLTGSNAKRVVLRGSLDLELVAVEPSGSMRRTRRRHGVSVEVPAEIKAKEMVAKRIDLGVLGKAPPHVFRRLRIQGSLRPEAVLQGEDREDRFLPLFPVEVRVVDARWFPVAADPLKRIRKAAELALTAETAQLLQATERELFMAALLAGPADREAAIDLLLEVLRAPAHPLRRVASAALLGITGQPIREPARWLRWAARRGR